MKLKKKLMAISLAAALCVAATVPTFAATNAPTEIGSQQAFDSWRAAWDKNDRYDTGKAALTPGKTPSELNFAWYSETAGSPVVRISTSSDMKSAKTFAGKADKINASNVNPVTGEGKTYKASNKVTVTGLQESTTYYYQYSTDGKTWSKAERVSTQDTASLKLLLVGDPQIGSSSAAKDDKTTGADSDIANDTYKWNYVINQAVAQNPDVNFILSAGDQINQSDASAASLTLREREYAGYLYPQALRNVPVATTIGNHESLVWDYKQHYNNPNSGTGLGSTASGDDYYFNYGSTLFISLNSNNRNVAEHSKLMEKALADKDSQNAKWKVVMFHHDIYGSGDPHSDVDGANLRALFAPLMDKFNIDVCLTGHDHSYARSYQILDGKVVDYGTGTPSNPQGTLYIAANSASGSKFYTQDNKAQYYIAKRDQQMHPNYSTIQITDGKFTITTIDAITKQPVDSTSIVKNADKASLLQDIADAKAIQASDSYKRYSEESKKAFTSALSAAEKLLETDKDGVPAELSGNYDKSVQGDNPNDVLNYYGYADTENERLPAGYAPFLDKTMDNSQKPVSAAALAAASKQLTEAIAKLAPAASSKPVSSGPASSKPVSSQVSSADSASKVPAPTTPSSTSSAGATTTPNTDTDDSDSPKTGDVTDMALLAVTVVLAGGGVAAVALRRKLRK